LFRRGLSEIFGLRELLVELAGQHTEAGDQSVENSFGVERRDEFKTQFAWDLPETVSQPTQILIRNPGDELAGVGVSFAEAGNVGAAPGLSLAGKLRALRAGCEYFSAETGHRVSSRIKKGPRGPFRNLYFYFYCID
jgi:hypothetical protein